MEGNVIKGKTKASSEIKMHLKIYKIRNDINAIIHAHPVYCTVATVAGIDLSANVLPEVVLTLGEIPVSPYATPTTDEVPASIENLIKTYNAIVLDRHGAVTMGADLITAYNRLEKIEHTAMILVLANQTGKIKILTKKQIDTLNNVVVKLGIKKSITKS